MTTPTPKSAHWHSKELLQERVDPDYEIERSEMRTADTPLPASPIRSARLDSTALLASAVARLGRVLMRRTA